MDTPSPPHRISPTTGVEKTNGGLLGVVPDYYRLGGRVADIVDRHRKGEPLAKIPIAGVEQPTLIVNRTTAKRLNVTFPKNALAGATFVD